MPEENYAAGNSQSLRDIANERPPLPSLGARAQSAGAFVGGTKQPQQPTLHDLVAQILSETHAISTLAAEIEQTALGLPPPKLTDASTGPIGKTGGSVHERMTLELMSLNSIRASMARISERIGNGSGADRERIGNGSGAADFTDVAPATPSANKKPAIA